MWLLGVEVDVAASGPSQLIALLKKKKKEILDFLGGPVVKNSPASQGPQI